MKDKRDHVKIVNNFVEKTIEEACNKSIELLKLIPGCGGNNNASRYVLRTVMGKLKFEGIVQSEYKERIKDEIVSEMLRDLEIREPKKPEEVMEEYQRLMKVLMKDAEKDITTFLHEYVNTCTEPKPTEKDMIGLIIQRIYSMPFSSTESKIRCYLVKLHYVSYYTDWYNRYDKDIREFSESCHKYAEERAEEIWENAKLDDNPFLPFIRK